MKDKSREIFSLLRRERERRGWSRSYVAEQIEVDIATVGRWERGERAPQPFYRQKLCTLFGKDPQALGLLLEEFEEFEASDDQEVVSDLSSAISEPNNELSQLPLVIPFSPSSSVRERTIDDTTQATSSNHLTPPYFRPSRFQKLLLTIVLMFVVLTSSGILLVYHSSKLPITITADAATSQARKSATLTAIADDPYLSDKGRLLVNDSLRGSVFWSEDIGNSWGGTCAFENGAYYITQNIGENRYFHCSAPPTLQSNNFSYEVQMTILQGSCGGITFRYSKTDHSGYRFQVCANGTALLRVYSNAATYTTLFAGISPAIRQGFNQSNIIAVVASSNHLDLYVNRQKIGSVTDTTFSKGGFALFVVDLNKSTEIAFSNVKIRQL